MQIALCKAFAQGPAREARDIEEATDHYVVGAEGVEEGGASYAEMLSESLDKIGR